MTFIELGYPDLAIAAVLLLLNALLSLGLRLALERRLLIAGLRMAVQLTLIGFVLKALFAAASPLWTALAALVMVLLAGYEIRSRQERRFAGWWSYGLGTSSILAAATIVTIFALTTQLRPEPWYDARYAIPLLGIILGNTMTGVSLGLNTLATLAMRERSAIEARLALGAERLVALRSVIRAAMRSAFIPTINAMSAAGLISLPGMMTGQILAGVDPQEAAKYQILIMLLISGGTGLGILAAVFLAVRRLTDGRHRLRIDRLSEPRPL